ncbi:MAG: hypothetical protein OHK0046_24380 [Anaerolineae bacterium]
MKILFVAMSESIHTTRWIAQIADQGWALHLFPAIDYGVVNQEMRGVTVYHSVYARPPQMDASVKTRGLNVELPVFKTRRYEQRRKIASALRVYLQYTRPFYREKALVDVIRKVKPDIIHSLNMQYGAYLTLAARDTLTAAGETFPTWIVTNWGSDIHLYGRLAEHQPKIQRVLELCDYYSCECVRDIELAKSHGLQGQVLPIVPNTGGLDMEKAARLRAPGQTSARKQIIIKGYQHFAGRALVALKAVEMCADVLQDYKITLFSAFPDVQLAAELLRHDTGLNIEFLPAVTHDEMLQQYGQSRVYIGLSISDAISTSMIEAMSMGTFPIQSCTACTDEWLVDGETGFAVTPEDPHVVAAALRRAVTDDALVDAAAERNFQVCAERLNQQKVRAATHDYYRIVMEGLRA